MRPYLLRAVLVLFLALIPSALHAAAESFVQNLEGTDVSFKMVPIPAGSVQMGSPPAEAGRLADEGPQHKVQIDAFFMEEHEVTWAEYELFAQNYIRMARHQVTEIPTDKLSDAVTYPTPIYSLEV